jgi:hypothetical protein
MRGMRLSVFSLLAVSVVLCLLSAPAIYGEHPWDRDYGKPGSLPATTVVGPGATTPTAPPQVKADTMVLGVHGVCPAPGSSGSVLSDWAWQLVLRMSNWMANDTWNVFGRDIRR